jgi:hypothetical protein
MQVMKVVFDCIRHLENNSKTPYTMKLPPKKRHLIPILFASGRDLTQISEPYTYK